MSIIDTAITRIVTIELKEVAKSLITEGVSTEIISKSTGLDIEIIFELQEQLKQEQLSGND